MKLVTILDANQYEFKNTVMHPIASASLPTATLIKEGSYFFNSTSHRPVIVVNSGTNAYKNFLLEGDTAYSCTYLPQLTTGDVTNPGSWPSAANTLVIGSGKVTNTMLAGSITLDKITPSGTTGGLIYNNGTNAAVHGYIVTSGTYNLSFSNSGTAIGLVNPTNAQDAATKAYVDNLVSGITDLHSPCQLGSGGSNIANLSSFNMSSLDYGTHTPVVNDRVLIKDQTDTAQNGIYYVSTFSSPTVALTRATDADGSGELKVGSTVLIQYGTIAGAKYTVTSVGGGTWSPGTTNIWVQSSAPVTSVSAGNGLTGTTTFSVLADGTSLSVSASGVRINASWIGQNTITTLGTITTGTWNGTAIGLAYGGTGVTSVTGYGNYVLGVNNGATAYEFKNIVGTTNRLTVTHTTNTVTLDISASYVGQSSITTLGTITTGTWNGTAVGVGYGGTGKSSWTLNGMVYASATNTLAQITNTATTQKFASQTGTGSAGNAPTWFDLFGTNNTWTNGQTLDTGNTTTTGYGAMLSLLRPAVSTTGAYSSHTIMLQGRAYNGSSLSYTNWYLQNKIIDNVATSAFTLSASLTGGTTYERFEFTDTGLLSSTDTASSSAKLRYARTWIFTLTSSATMRDGSALSIASANVTVKHQLNNTMPQVSVYEVSTSSLVFCDVTCSDANTVVLGFGSTPASGAYTVVITG